MWDGGTKPLGFWVQALSLHRGCGGEWWLIWVKRCLRYAVLLKKHVHHPVFRCARFGLQLEGLMCQYPSPRELLRYPARMVKFPLKISVGCSLPRRRLWQKILIESFCILFPVIFVWTTKRVLKTRWGCMASDLRWTH